MTEMARKYGKHDLERLGIFVEMPYMNGKGYVSPFPSMIFIKLFTIQKLISFFPEPKIYKGRNIMCEGRKSKNGTQHGYFDDTFRRLFEGEAIARPPKRKAVGEGKK